MRNFLELAGTTAVDVFSLAEEEVGTDGLQQRNKTEKKKMKRIRMKEGLITEIYGIKKTYPKSKSASLPFSSSWLFVEH
jgi:hypothetical protein